MKIRSNEKGSTLVACLTTILIISAVGANVLYNCATRYNTTANHVRAWKEALQAAEAGGDIAYAECRKAINGTPFGGASWIKDNTAATPTWTSSPAPFGQNGSLTSTVTVDEFTQIQGSRYYRIRASGTARLAGLNRVGMDSSMSSLRRGDNFLRQIDFKVDHFKARFGDGDSTTGTITPVPHPQVTRRIELIAAPVLPFEGAIKADGSFAGPGSAGRVDSYDSHNGAYQFVANNPSHPWYEDSRNGNVAVNSPNFVQGGPIYGDVGTNGGNVTRTNTNISGSIDNTISFDLPEQKEPTIPVGNPAIGTDLSTITPTATASNPSTPNWVRYTGNFHNVNISALNDGAGSPVETYINVIVSGDVGDVTVPKGVTLRVYFKGNVNTKARDLVNDNVDGATGVKKQVWNADGTAARNADNSLKFVASDHVSRAGHMQFYGISPANGGTQTINIGPPGNVWATFYAPDANMYLTGNPDWYGAIVCKSFEGNGNTGFHYDKALAGLIGDPIDYRIAHYVEDVR